MIRVSCISDSEQVINIIFSCCSTYLGGLGTKSGKTFCFARFIDHEETWKYTNGREWC